MCCSGDEIDAVFPNGPFVDITFKDQLLKGTTGFKREKEEDVKTQDDSQDEMARTRRTFRAKDRLFVNADCVIASRKYLADNSVDLMICDPPFGIHGDKLDRHYNRNKKFVVPGYIEVPGDKYAEFSKRWIAEAARVLRPGGTIYVVSGRTHLGEVLGALEDCGLLQRDLIAWKYNFGVWTTKRPVTSHYHIPCYTKAGGKVTYNTWCRYGRKQLEENKRDREDVWLINRQYKRGKEKNQNELPDALVMKMIQYSSKPGDLVVDFFLGGGTTARVALGLDRRAIGFEKSPNIFARRVLALMQVERGSIEFRKPRADT